MSLVPGTRALLILAAIFAASWAAAAASTLVVWELPAGAKAGLDSREGWKRVEPDAGRIGPSASGMAVENGSLVAFLLAGGDAVTLLRKPAGQGDAVKQELVLLDDAGRPCGQLAKLSLAEYGKGHALAAFAAGGAEARLKLGAGGMYVEILPGRGAAALRIRATSRFSFVPDFFGNDVLLDAQELAAGKVFAPAENFMVNLLDGHRALTMITWPIGGADEVLLLPEGQGANRRFSATQVRFGGKSLFVAVLAAEGIWYSHDLRAAVKDKALAVQGWTPPFPAKWMTILVKRPQAGAKTGIAPETVPIPPLPAQGDTPYSDVFVHPHVPSWFTGTQWRLYLETSLTFMMTQEKISVPDFLVALNYPRDRVKETPLTAFTLVDVMRETLGAGPCEYILDLEGLNKTRSSGAAGTGKPKAAATCAERGGLINYYVGERAESPRREDSLIATDEALVSVEKIKDFLDAAHARIQEYLAWSDQIVSFARETKAREPQTAELAGRIIAAATEMRTLWNKMIEHNKPCAFPTEWRMALDHCKDLIRAGAPDLGARIREFDPQMRGAGEEVDGGMQAMRMLVKRVRMEAALAGSEEPEALKLAATLRERCREILRNKHYKEGDSVQLGAGRPE